MGWAFLPPVLTSPNANMAPIEKDVHSPEPTNIDGHPSSGLGHATIRGMAPTADRDGHICRQVSAEGFQER